MLLSKSPMEPCCIRLHPPQEWLRVCGSPPWQPLHQKAFAPAPRYPCRSGCRQSLHHRRYRLCSSSPNRQGPRYALQKAKPVRRLVHSRYNRKVSQSRLRRAASSRIQCRSASPSGRSIPFFPKTRRIVKNRGAPPKSWRWEIYRAGRSNPIRAVTGLFSHRGGR